jgi:hypothetical protein
MNSLNLVEDITKTLNNESNIYIENETDSSYTRYLELLDVYFSESCKPKFNNKFNYYVDNDGRFIKKAIEKSDEKDSMVIIKPKYIDITDRLNELDRTIKDMESTLRQYRTGLLYNDLSIKDAFDKLYNIYTDLINERDSIREYNNKINNIDANKEMKLKLKLDNINLNLTQYSLFNSIKLFKEEEDIQKYLLNNELVNSNITKVNDLKNKSTNDFIVKEVFNNNLPTKKKILKKPKKPKKTKKENQKEAEDETFEEAEDETFEESEDEKQKEAEDEKQNEAEDETFEEAEDEKQKEADDEKQNEADDEKQKEAEDETFEESEDEKQKEAEEKQYDDLQLEEIDLSKDAVDQSELKLDLKYLFNESDSEDEEYVFNKEKKPPTDDGETIQLNLEEAVKSNANANVEDNVEDNTGSSEELDLDKLSRQLNKKAKENIKIIKVDPHLQFSNIKCDDSKTTRSGIKTTNIAGGKKRRKKDMDPELKNCMFPFKEIKGKGKNKKEIIHDGCTDTGIEDWCATERNEDCTTKKWGYCDK